MTADLHRIERSWSESISVSLAHYQAGGTQKSHYHDYTQVSILLSGRLLERHGAREWVPAVCAVGRKPAGTHHENQWGADGALIFSVKLRGAGKLEEVEAMKPTGWSSSRGQPYLRQLVGRCITRSDALRQDAVEELLALAGAPSPPHRSPPGWLRTAIEAFEDAPSLVTVAEAARLAGVHRAYFSSVFTRHLGIPPSVYRHDLMVARAISRLVRGKEPMTSIAHEEGFSDQAHLSRSVRAAAGANPRLLRQWLRKDDTGSSIEHRKGYSAAN